jgi:hypothetical protein
MLQIPLGTVPQQTLNTVLDGQNVSLSLYTLPVSAQWYSLGQPNLYNVAAQFNYLFLDVLLAGAVIKTCIQCLNLQRLLADCQYTQFIGDFVFVDTQGNTNPIYTGLGSRYQLIYLEAADLAVSILA